MTTITHPPVAEVVKTTLAPDIIFTTEASQITGLPEATLRYYAHEGRGPKSFKLGRRRAYLRGDVLAWVQSQYDRTVTGEGA